MFVSKVRCIIDCISVCLLLTEKFHKCGNTDGRMTRGERREAREKKRFSSRVRSGLDRARSLDRFRPTVTPRATRRRNHRLHTPVLANYLSQTPVKHGPALLVRFPGTFLTVSTAAVPPVSPALHNYAAFATIPSPCRPTPDSSNKSLSLQLFLTPFPVAFSQLSFSRISKQEKKQVENNRILRANLTNFLQPAKLLKSAFRHNVSSPYVTCSCIKVFFVVGLLRGCCRGSEVDFLGTHYSSFAMLSIVGNSWQSTWTLFRA